MAFNGVEFMLKNLGIEPKQILEAVEGIRKFAETGAGEIAEIKKSINCVIANQAEIMNRLDKLKERNANGRDEQ